MTATPFGRRPRPVRRCRAGSGRRSPRSAERAGRSRPERVLARSMRSSSRRARPSSRGRAARCGRTGRRAGPRARASTTSDEAEVAESSRRLTPAQAEADAADRLDPAAVAELAAQRRDVDVDRLRRSVPASSPRPPRAGGGGDHGTGIASERGEQIELLRRQVELAPVERARAACAHRPRGRRPAAARARRAGSSAPVA